MDEIAAILSVFHEANVFGIMNTSTCNDPLLHSDHGVQFISALTRGDGACGLHAMFGDVGENGKLVLDNARDVVGHLLNRPLLDIRRATGSSIELNNIIAEWWSEFLTLAVFFPAIKYIS